MTKSVLIANRGEIAVRIAKTLKRLGFKVYGLASALDPEPLSQKFTDETLTLKGDTLKETYLNIVQIIDLAQKHKIDFIHPGYGFLSENADFALKCEIAKMGFVGPTSQTIRDMGSKANAKKIMKTAGVPVVPGYEGDDQNLDRLIKEAKDIGCPLLIKASAGGGGKGMRLVQNEADLKAAIESAQSESLKAFGDQKLILEKYIQSPRHIEFQIFGDHFGQVVHLGERECSIQRRHQKVIEEAPSPTITKNLREKMAKASLECAKATHYVNAGTVEYIVDANDNFYFLEMNTRLQVEHPVTESITGLDLVEWQMIVAQKQPLPLLQNQITFTGHAIEARVYAEDPSHGFLPSVGTLFECAEPNHAGIRIDCGVTQNSVLSLDFDPMIAKVIAKSDQRSEAILKLALALKEYKILGVLTNQAFLIELLTHPGFLKAKLHTHFIDEHFSDFKDEPPAELLNEAKAFWNAPLNKTLPSVFKHFEQFRIK